VIERMSGFTYNDKMQYANLGKSGLKVSRICLGMMSYGTPQWREWVLDYNASVPFIKAALDAGINFFDTAQMYSDGESEVVLGKALIELGVKRSDVVIATKIHPAGSVTPGYKNVQVGLSRKAIFHHVEQSLKRLQMDYIDLYQLHRWDNSTPIEETMRALHDLVVAGKIRYIGMSSCYAWQFAKAQHVAEKLGLTKFISMQNHYNAVYREEEREMNPLCLDQGVGLIPWSPLARGFLSGTRTREDKEDISKAQTTRIKSDPWSLSLYYRDSDWKVLDAVKAIAVKRNVKPAQIALAWMLQRPGVSSPIIGATKMYQLTEAIEAAQIVLTKEEIASIDAPYEPHPILGH